ncbi:MscL family protein [Mycoplasmopsis felis]|uniref:large conductance mechanosensitive channel protein MscL n=1 Tax=Mycoplasmopsis felis TaxID=33923 RepID=UPI002AFEB3E1|nr:MscL family protein [Mycoplasmopsis felis]WQQ05143.1 MscL family protein [Mycoplasmopsis felis]
MKKNNLLKESLKESMKFFKKGNMILLAIGFIAGSVFSAVVSSLSNDIILSAIAYNILGDKFKDLESLSWNGIKWGKFLGTFINFIVVTLVLFIILTSYYSIKILIQRRKATKMPVDNENKEVIKKSSDELIIEQLQLINEQLKNQNNKNPW